MTKFEPGKTYTTRSIADHETVISITVVSRTAKTITVKGDSLTKPRLRVSEFEGREMVFPWGRFSMSPVIQAK